MSHHHHHHGHHHHGHDENGTAHDLDVMMDPVTFSHLLFAKVITMVVLGVASFLLGVIPIKLIRFINKKSDSSRKSSLSVHQEHHHHHHHDQNQPLVVSLLLCFGGGVLLFTTFLHLGPEVRENMEELREHGLLPEFLLESDIHLADLIFCAGFFLVYFIDEAVHSILDSSPPVLEEEAVLHRTMSLRKCRHSDFTATNHRHKTGTLIPRVTLNNTNAAPANMMPPDNSLLSSVSTISKQGLLLTTATTNASSGGESSLNNGLSTSPPTSVGISTTTTTGGTSADGLLRIPKAPSSDVEQDESTVSSSNHDDAVSQSFRGLFAILALSFHEVFEGLAVGLETNVQSVWYLFAAISTHKLVISFCMGVDLLSTGTKISVMMMYIFCFAIVTPVGILIGILLLIRHEESPAGGTLLTFVLQGLSSGTLLYVTFFEVLRRDRSNAKAGFLQLLAVITGFGLMLMLQILNIYWARNANEMVE